MTIKRLIIIAKLIGTGLVIACVALGMALFGSPRPISDANADIIDWFAGRLNSEQEFNRILNQMGLTPRVYDVNGNTFYFGVTYLDMKPDEVIADLQRQFVARSINEDNHTQNILSPQRIRGTDGQPDTPEQLIASQALLRGDIVPFEVSSNYAAMGGISLRTAPESIDQLLNAWNPSHGPFALENSVHRYRFIDATFEPETGKTLITAVWTDGQFDASKMKKSATGVPVDTIVPVCMGCERTFRIESLEREEPYVSNHFRTRSSIAFVAQFYREAMVARGWKENHGTHQLDRLSRDFFAIHNTDKATLLEFVKGEEVVTLTLLPGNTHDDFTTIIAVLGPLY